jgi:hypothetical protein
LHAECPRQPPTLRPRPDVCRESARTPIV